MEVHMKKIIFLFSFLFSFLLVSCLTAYGPMYDNSLGGFSDTQLDKDLFVVNYYGNTYTSSERVSDLALLRAANLATENGFPYFKVIDSHSRIATTYTVIPEANFVWRWGPYPWVPYRPGHGYPYRWYHRRWFRGHWVYYNDVVPVEAPVVSMTVRMLKDKSEGAYDAAFIDQSIRAKYGLDENEGK
jgi:hypothetical protein